MPDNFLTDQNVQQALGFYQPANPQMPSDPGDLASLLGYSAAPDASVATGPITQPGQTDTSLGAQFPHPDVGTPISPTPGLPPNVSVGAGAKVGVAGYNPTANAAIQRGPHAAVDRQMAADRAEVASQFAPIQQTEHSAAVLAEQAAMDAGQLESRKLAVTSEARQNIAKANQDFMTKEQAAIENARAESQTSMANYRAAIVDYAASQVNPSQLWENADKAGQIGMVATAFMHDFLAAKGIQTTGLESLNKAIQQNISSQLDNMRKKLDVAQGFKQLWDMQRAQSATDAEARQRMNGFYLAALDNQLQAQLGSYDSKLALVKAQAARAGIQQEMAKNDLLVQKHIDDAANQRATNRVHMYSAELGASSARYTADAHVKAAEIAAGKNQVSPLANVIFDTSKSGGNLAKRRLIVEDKEGKIRSQAANVYNTVGNIEKLIDIQDEIAKAPPDIGVAAFKRLQSEEQRVAELVRNSVKMGIIYDQSGKQINEQEVALYDELVGKKDWFLNGDNIRTLGTLAKSFLDKENSMLSGISVEILPGDPAYGVSSGQRNMAPGEQALTDIQSAPGAGRHQNTDTEDYYKEVTAPHANEEALFKKGVFRGQDEEQKLEFGSFYNKFLKSYGDLPGVPENPSKAFVGTAKLFQAAKQGDEKAQEHLRTIAEKPPGGDPLLTYYAEWELSQLSNKKP